jgi:hypothetical protein
MTLRLKLAFVALGTLLMVAQVPAQQHGRILLGVLEDHPGNYSGQPYFRAVRVVFEKVGAEWRAFPSQCPDQDCLRKISSRYPREVTWNIGLHGKILGSVTGQTYSEFPFYFEVGFQKIISRGPVPTVGKRSEEFSDFTGEPAYRPLVANSQPNFKDAQDWHRSDLSPRLVVSLRQRFREKFPHVENCRNPHENSLRPWPYRDENIRVGRSLATRDGWQLAILGLSPSRCDYTDDPAFDGWTIVVSPNGTAWFIGRDLGLMDSGDYSDTGESEVLFQVGGENLGGYELFYDHFRKHVSFTFNYH